MGGRCLYSMTPIRLGLMHDKMMASLLMFLLASMMEAEKVRVDRPSRAWKVMGLKGKAYSKRSLEKAGRMI